MKKPPFISLSIPVSFSSTTSFRSREMASGKAYEDALLSKKGKGNPHPKRGEIKRKIFRELFGTGKAYEGNRYAPQRRLMSSEAEKHTKPLFCRRRARKGIRIRSGARSRSRFSGNSSELKLRAKNRTAALKVDGEEASHSHPKWPDQPAADQRRQLCFSYC
ncbi:hypothetical protein ACLOJK_001567 [Asimina triloba]